MPDTSERPNTSEREVQLILEEYKALRQEIIFGLDKRITLLSLGLTSVAILVGTSVSSIGGQTAHYFLASVVLSGVVPAVELYILEIWLHETRRGRRASQYIYALEERINRIVGKECLRWEHRIRSPGVGSHFTDAYGWIVGFFTISPAVSFFFGVICLFKDFGSQTYEQELLLYGGALVVSSGIAGLGFHHYRNRALSLIEAYNAKPPASDLV